MPFALNVHTCAERKPINAFPLKSHPTSFQLVITATTVKIKGLFAMLTPSAHKILTEQRHLEPELLARLGLYSLERNDGEWIGFPTFIGSECVNKKFRTIGGEKKFYQEANGKQCFWNFNVLTDSSLEALPLIITEGEFDAIAAIQSGFARVVSVPAGAPAQAIGDQPTEKYKFIDETLKLLSGCKEIILATDGDDAGVNLMNDLALRLGRSRCKWVKYPFKKGDKTKRCKDLNDVLINYGEAGVTACLSRAEWINREGVYAMDELQPITERQVHEIGFPVLDNHYRIRKGDFCVTIGYPSHGKSTFLNDVACRMAKKYQWRIAFASFEQTPQTDHKRNLRSWFLTKDAKYASPEQLIEADKWINEHFRFMVPREEDSPTLEWLLEKITMAAVQHNCSMIIVDPWNELCHVWAQGMNKTDYIGYAIKELKKLAKIYDLHLIVAAHPAKPTRFEGKFPVPTLYDVSDTMNFSNKADVGITVYRPDMEVNRTQIIITKARYPNLTGSTGTVEMHYLPDARRYQATETR